MMNIALHPVFRGGSILLVAIFLLVLGGCGDPRVHGTITFSDGSPLKTGVVCFESADAVYYADVSPKGTYSMGKTRNNQGIPVGTYVVFFQDASEVERIDEENRPHYRRVIDDKFFAGKTSGLTCAVDGKTRFDIRVTAPEKQR